MPSTAVPPAAPPADSGPPLGPSRRGIAIRIGISLVLAVAFAAALWPYLRAIPEDLTIAAWAIPAYALSLLPYHLARAGRWHFLLRPLGTVRGRDSLRVSMAGYMWIALLPFRLGEFARPLLLTQCSDITVHRALGTVAIERVLDGLIICALFFAASAGVHAGGLVELQQGATLVMAMFGLALMGLLLMARFPSAMGTVINATIGRVWPRAGTFASTLSQGVSEGLAALPRGGPLLSFVGVTLLYWASNAAGMWILARGCGLPLSLADATLVMAVMNIALLVPGGPAQFGIFQTGVALGLSVMLSAEVIQSAGSVFAFYLYLCQLSTIVAAGVWAQRSLGLDWRAVLGRRPPQEPAS